MGRQTKIKVVAEREDEELEAACTDLDEAGKAESTARAKADKARQRVMDLMEKKDRRSYTNLGGTARFDLITTPEKVKVAIKRLEVTHEDATDEAAEE